MFTANIRAKEDTAQANQMVFVVLKGLEEEKPIRGMLDAVGGARAMFDARQIAQAQNPDGSEYEGG